VGEELGLLGTITLILLFMLFVWRGIYIATYATDQFASLISLGIITQIGLQSVINIGVTTGLLPTKGINLPFISYGGSSLVMTLISVGILLNISRHLHEDV
jgi:cell division protein FtsW